MYIIFGILENFRKFQESYGKIDLENCGLFHAFFYLARLLGGIHCPNWALHLFETRFYVKQAHQPYDFPYYLLQPLLTFFQKSEPLSMLWTFLQKYQIFCFPLLTTILPFFQQIYQLSQILSYKSKQTGQLLVYEKAYVFNSL